MERWTAGKAAAGGEPAICDVARTARRLELGGGARQRSGEGRRAGARRPGEQRLAAAGTRSQRRRGTAAARRQLALIACAAGGACIR